MKYEMMSASFKWLRIEIMRLQILIYAVPALTLTAAVPYVGPAKGTTLDAFPNLGKAKLLIVAPKLFVSALQPLVEHKNRTGMPTALVSLEEIKAAWTSTEDDPAKIKRTIWKYATAQSPIKYVMLVGDMSLLPCRRRTIENLPGNPDALIWRWAYEPAEMYYSNLFTRHRVISHSKVVAVTHEFNSWDKNGNGMYNEQHWAADVVKFNPDNVDGCPDVALSRIPAHSGDEVSVFVSKVIAYESGEIRSSNKHAAITLCFGKTYDESYDMTKDIRDQSGIQKTFASGKVTMLGLGYDKPSDLPAGGKDSAVGDLAAFAKALQNSLWLGYLGHGSALGWDAQLPNGSNRQYVDSRYIGTGDLPDAASNRRLPIIFSCGCETGRHAPGLPRDEYMDVNGKKHWFWWGNAQKNSKHRVVDDLTGDYWDSQVVIPAPSAYDLPEYQPRNFASSWLFSSSSKGAIAYFGEELVCQNDMGRDLEIRVLQNFDPRKNGCILGDAWLKGQQQYWKEFHDYEGDNCVFRNARIYLGIMNFYGDPSLRIH